MNLALRTLLLLLLVLPLPVASASDPVKPASAPSDQSGNPVRGMGTIGVIGATLPIASNTMTSTADLITREVGFPVLYIADAVGARVKAAGIGKVALLDTKYTMEADFHRDHLRKKLGLTPVVPNTAERDVINAVIVDSMAIHTQAAVEHAIGASHEP